MTACSDLAQQPLRAAHPESALPFQLATKHMVHQIRDPQVNRHTANFRRLLRLLPIGENPIQEIGGTELEPRPPPLLDQRTHPIGRQGIRIRMLHHSTLPPPNTQHPEEDLSPDAGVYDATNDAFFFPTYSTSTRAVQRRREILRGTRGAADR